MVRAPQALLDKSKKLIAWILAAGLAGLLFAHPVLYPRKPAYALLLILVGAGWVFVLSPLGGKGTRHRILPQGRLVWTTAFFLTCSVWSVAGMSGPDWYSLCALISLFLFVGLGWWLGSDRDCIGLLAGTALLGAGIASLYGLLQYFQLDFLPPGTLFADRVVSSFENPNYFGNYLAGVLSLGLAAFFRGSTGRARLGWAVLVGLVYSGLLIAGSRGAWWAALAGCVVLLGGFVLQLYRGAVVLRPLWAGGLLILLGSITAFFYERPVGYGPGGPISVSQRILSSRNIVGAGVEQDVGINHRYLIWKVTWEMIREKLLVGHGYGAYQSRFVEVRQALQEKGRFPTEQWNTRFDARYAHNEYLHIWAEGGIFLLAGFLGFISLVLGGAVRAGWYTDIERLDLWGGLGLAVAMLVHSLVSYPLHLPLNGMVFWLSLGILANRNFLDA